MFGIIGIVVILVMVFGGFVIHGGHLAPIMEALPFEMIMIGGAALGSFLVSNDLAAVKKT
ncbi:MAG: flagellar motor stator protein MotA, partial [Cypionkella sp.]|nr:flagellar motor stator protein MotA [Cypionkella sp.]